MCVHACVCVHARGMRVYMYMCLYMCECSCVSMCVHLCAYVYVCMCTSVCVHICVYLCVHAHVCRCVCLCVCLHSCNRYLWIPDKTFRNKWAAITLEFSFIHLARKSLHCDSRNQNSLRALGTTKGRHHCANALRGIKAGFFPLRNLLRLECAPSLLVLGTRRGQLRVAVWAGWAENVDAWRSSLPCPHIWSQAISSHHHVSVHLCLSGCKLPPLFSFLWTPLAFPTEFFLRSLGPGRDRCLPFVPSPFWDSDAALAC